ncbi:LemA family protein [Williamsoniiplasma luminosum]|uniref:LemA family protein n=1 Tax=Williamsoniiplasma luminosum TaxID=214888 RepID=A0A2S0NKN7_9MOLU|nr:LemA family protein [Williamsoniiplasma luminosum]AVP49580.1 MAG: LemA family protein [Williamsoniiplasma luminosum]
MANKLDELQGPTKPEGVDINVIHKQIPIEVGQGSRTFEIVLWCLLIIPGLIFWIMKNSASNYLRRLEQKIQGSASEVDNYLEQRVQVLQNASAIVNKAIDLDKSTMITIAKYRSGKAGDDNLRNEISSEIEQVSKKINIAFESYPDLKAHSTLRDAMQKNDYLQREITAARTNYNDYVSRWNQDIQVWPTKMIVAAKAGYKTRIPFTASVETKAKARDVFF